MTLVLLPRLAPHHADILLREYACKQPETLRAMARNAHPRQTYGAIGTRLEARAVEELVTELRAATTLVASGNRTDTVQHREWDVLAAKILWARLGHISAGEAGRQDVWTFLCTVACPDLVIWRFPWPDGENPVQARRPRFFGGRRNLLARLWWRARAVESAGVQYDALGTLGEDDLVQIFERPSVAGVPRLPGYLIQVFADLQRQGVAVSVRDVLKRINRDLAITVLASLSGEQLLARVHSLAVKAAGTPKRVRELSKVSEPTGMQYAAPSLPQVVRISLLGQDGEVQGGDGLNWWRESSTGAIRRGRPDEACIAIRAAHIDHLISVFGTLRPGTIWHATTGSGTEFDVVLQGTGVNGHAKQIASAGDLQTLGHWILRDMMKLAPGTRVTAALLLEKLGTTDITITRTGIRPDGSVEVQLGFSSDDEHGDSSR